MVHMVIDEALSKNEVEEKMEEKVGRLPVKLNDCTVKLTFYAPLYQKPCLMKNSKFNTGKNFR